MMQFTQTQIRKLLALRQTYIQQLVLMSKQRQQVLRQLQNQSLSQVEREYLSSRHVTVDAIPQQLVECENMEYVLYMQYVIAVAHGVSWYLHHLLVQGQSTQTPLSCKAAHPCPCVCCATTHQCATTAAAQFPAHFHCFEGKPR